MDLWLAGTANAKGIFKRIPLRSPRKDTATPCVKVGVLSIVRYCNAILITLYVHWIQSNPISAGFLIPGVVRGQRVSERFQLLVLACRANEPRINH